MKLCICVGIETDTQESAQEGGPGRWSDGRDPNPLFQGGNV